MEETEREVQEFIKENIKVEIRIEEVRKINGDRRKEVVIPKLESWEHKREIIKKKKKLRNRVYIEDDSTWEEKEIQRRLRGIAKEKRAESRRAKVGYMKICINERWYERLEQEGE